MTREGGENLSSAAPEQGHRISITVIIAVAVGIVVFLGLCGALFFFIGRSRLLKEVVNERNDDAVMKPAGVG
jgi:hypothetical protein